MPNPERAHNCPSFYRASWSTWLVMMAFFVSLTVSRQLLSQNVVPSGIYSWLVAFIPIAVGTLVLRSFIRFMRALDDYWMKIYLHAMAFSFGATFVALICYPILELANAPRIDGYVIGAFSLFVFGTAAIYLARRYG